MRKGLWPAGIALISCCAVGLLHAADAAAPVTFVGSTKDVDVNASTISAQGIVRRDGALHLERVTFVVTGETKLVFLERPAAKELADVKAGDVCHVTYNSEAKKDGKDIAISIKVQAELVFMGPAKAVDLKASTITVTGLDVGKGTGAKKTKDVTFVVTQETEVLFAGGKGKVFADIKVGDFPQITYLPAEEPDGNPVAVFVGVFPGPPKTPPKGK